MTTDPTSDLRTHDITLTGDRVTLRPMTEHDWPLIESINNNPEVSYFSEEDEWTPYTLEHLQRIYRSISSTELFFEEFFTDLPHLEAYLQQTPANISDWRLGTKPYDPARDRPALELYARHFGILNGIRLQRQRWVFTQRRVDPARYPVDAAT